MRQLVTRFRDTLPEFLHTQPEQGGALRWLPKALAIQYERFRGHLNDRHYLIVDCDRPIPLAHNLYDLEPNWLCYNPVSHRHQAFWLLSDPVHCHPAAQQRQPWRYLRAIESAFDVRYQCDPHFARYIHRNPTHHAVDTDWRHERPHTLHQLAEVVELNPHRVFAGDRASAGRGRNVTLFDSLRYWAYPRALEARQGDYPDWHSQVVTRALALNAFAEPLPLAEVYSVAKSVAEFTFYRYRPAGATVTDEYRRQQAENGRVGGLKSKGGGRPKGSTKRDSETTLRPWEALGISRSTYYRRKAKGGV